MKKDNIPLNFTEENKPKISLICSILTLIILCFVLTQIDHAYTATVKEALAKEEAAQKKAEEEALAAKTTTTSANFLAVGDNLYHTSLYNSGNNGSDTWNYDHVYENITSYIQAADLAIVDQETVFTSDHSEVSSYPEFATPMEVGDALVNAGFDVIRSANGHMDDFGSDLILDTLDFWKTNHPDTTVLGIHETQEDADTVKVIDVNGIKVAFLNYASGSNTNQLKEENKPYMVDYLNKERVADMIAKAKEVSDCIVFTVQWGDENRHEPDEAQRDWANFLLEQGVDVTIGTHSNYLQPYETLTNDNGDEMLVFYSLGNFVSVHEEVPKLLGGMAKFTLEKTVKNKETTIKVTAASVDPLVMHYNYESGDYSPYLLSDYTDELAAQHSILDMTSEEFTPASLRSLFDQVMAANATSPQEPSEDAAPDEETDSNDDNYDDYDNDYE